MPHQRTTSTNPSRKANSANTRRASHQNDRATTRGNQRGKRSAPPKKSNSTLFIVLGVIVCCLVIGGVAIAALPSSTAQNTANSSSPPSTSNNQAQTGPELTIDQTSGTISTSLTILDKQTDIAHATMIEFYKHTSRQMRLGLEAALKDASNHIKDHGFEARLVNAEQAVQNTMNRVNLLPESPAKSAMLDLHKEWKAAVDAVKKPNDFDLQSLEGIFNQFKPKYQNAKEKVQSLL